MVDSPSVVRWLALVGYKEPSQKNDVVLMVLVSSFVPQVAPEKWERCGT